MSPAQDLPLDLVEQFIHAQGWTCRRVHDDEVAAEYRGKWCDYSLHFAWSNEVSAFHFTCAFDVRIPDAKKGHVNQLLALANDKLWLGHFGIWHEEGLPMYRHALPLRALNYQQNSSRISWTYLCRNVSDSILLFSMWFGVEKRRLKP